MYSFARRILALAFATSFIFAVQRTRADVITDWNGTMVSTIAAQNPFAQARFAAITELAVFEAVNACNGNYNSYLGTVKAPSGASADAAASVAAHDVLKFYFPSAAISLDTALASSLAAIPNGQPKNDGIAVGMAAAAALIAARTNDGSAPPETFLPSSTAPGVWQPTPPAFGPGILLQWRNVTPFGIRSSRQFRSSPPPELVSFKYARSFQEVKAVGDVNSTLRPQDRTDVARFFAAASASYAWNTAARQIFAAHPMALVDEARAFALLNMAMSDGLVSSMETKYFYVFWRPVTAIHEGDADGNKKTDADASFTPFIVTPSFPSYPSAHASASYAAREVLERIVGFGKFSITLTHPAVPNVVLHYDNLETITDDVDDARVYGGIHFRFDQEAGAKQGYSVGSYVFEHNLLPREQEPD